MSQSRHSGQRLLCAAGITLALLGLAGPSAAQEANAMVVVKDAETGQLRAPTAAEAAALTAPSPTARTAMRKPAQQILSKTNKHGIKGFRLTDESLSTSVAVRKADGSIERQCYDAHGAADTAVATGHVHTTNHAEVE